MQFLFDVFVLITFVLISLPLTPEKEKAEWQTILTIANNNNFPLSIIKKLKSNKKPKQKPTNAKNGSPSPTTVQGLGKLLILSNKHQDSIQEHQYNTPKNQTQKPSHNARL
jgi:hypothetical protein